MQKFAARESFAFTNDAIGWRPGGPFDCLGPYAKVTNCPIHGTELTAHVLRDRLCGHLFQRAGRLQNPRPAH
jgi:hypothetical protein